MFTTNTRLYVLGFPGMMRRIERKERNKNRLVDSIARLKCERSLRDDELVLLHSLALPCVTN
jgi:hypothetical protein